MYRTFILITTFINPVIAMSQTITFNKTVQQLYFGVDVKNLSTDTIINEFKQVAYGYHGHKGVSSLSVNLDVNMSGNAKKVSHIFNFIKSPLPNMVVDSGYIKVDIGEVENCKKIIDIDWCFQFVNKADAERFFEELKNLFSPLSTKQKIGEDELNSGLYAEFSTRKEHVAGIRDVTFFFGKSVVANKYEVRFIPYNEFVE